MSDINLEKILVPQKRLELITAEDLIKETIDVRTTIIYDLDDQGRMIVAQTSPPILRSWLGQAITASFLTRDEKNRDLVRYGFPTRIEDLWPEYQLREDVIETAVLLGPPLAEVEVRSVRLLYRVQPSSRHEIGLAVPRLDDGEVHLIDISQGGLQFSYKGSVELVRGQTIRLTLDVAGNSLALDARVARASEQESSRLAYIGVQFSNPEPHQVRIIQQAVQSIIREEARAKSGIEA